MKSPPYHLRPNKAADRFALIEAIRRLPLLGAGGLDEYTYFGLGGPYLEDFRLLYEFCPEMSMVSIENNDEAYKRQKFNIPFRTLRLMKEELSSFINHLDLGDAKSIFWLDYIALEYSCFQDFMTLLGLVADNSMIKITLRCEPEDFWNFDTNDLKDGQPEKFRRKFGQIMPDPSGNPPRLQQNLANLLQDMLQIVTERMLPPITNTRTFIPISSFYYKDGAGMFTLTGIICHINCMMSVKRAYENWEFAKLEWERPSLISLPVLSTKERLHLQRILPIKSPTAGRKLHQLLGYQIEEDLEETEKALKQYAEFHRYSPYFIRGIP